MFLLQLTVFNWLLAATPILTLLMLLLGLRQSARTAGFLALLVALGIGSTIFGASLEVIGVALGKGALLTIDVLYIVLMALLFFNVANEAGAIDLIGDRLPGLTANRGLQVLLLGWLFVSFLQGVGGFGVPTAVVAPLLITLGYEPVKAVIIASIGHGWAVTFGSLGTSFQALIATTGLSGFELAPDSALLLGVAGVVCGGLVVFIGTGWKTFIQTLPIVLLLGGVMGTTQFLLARAGLWALGATGAALTGLIVGVLLVRFVGGSVSKVAPTPTSNGITLSAAVAAYLILIATIFGINLIPVFDRTFNTVVLALDFPAVATSLGWVTPVESGRRISLFGHPGALLLYASLITYAIYQHYGYYKSGAGQTIIRNVLRTGVKSGVGIAVMIAVAVIMNHAGMTNTLAQGISENISARAYPAAAPFIGMLGAFITGSNTNSNVIFGILQRDSADLLGLSVTLILAAQTAGGALGSTLAPAKVIVGCSTVGLAGQEGPVINRMLGYGIIPIIVVALVTLGISAL